MAKRPKEEMQRIWRQYKKTGDTSLRNILIEEHLPIVKYVAERLFVKLPHSVDVDDLTSAGIFGLVDAIDRFDIERGVKFETYCTNRIRGAILDELRALDWVPRLVRQRAHKLERAVSKLEAKHGRAPSDTELARELGVSLESYDEMVKEVSTAAILSQSAKWTGEEDEEGGGSMEVLEDKQEPGPTEDLQKRELVDFITKHLTKKERLILLLYYYEELTMKEIGATLDLSESRVCQIHSRVMLRLRHQLKKMSQELT